MKEPATHRFQAEGFGIPGCFVFGFDFENKDVFEQTLEFAMKSCMDCVQLRILTPYPGTRLYSRLLREGRLFDGDWWLKGYPPGTICLAEKVIAAAIKHHNPDVGARRAVPRLGDARLAPTIDMFNCPRNISRR